MRSTGTTLTVLAALAALAGCSAGDPAGSPPTSPTSPSPVSVAPSDWPTAADPLPTGSATVINEDTGQIVEPQVVPSWDEASRESAKQAAVEVMGAFARPGSGVGPDEWWKRLESHLTSQAATVYASVDPANVPATKVTGAARIVDDTSAYTAFVKVPTDAGDYTITVTRSDAEPRWLVERIMPPKGTNR